MTLTWRTAANVSAHAAIGALLVLGGYVTGRRNAPVRTETREVVKMEEVAKEVERVVKLAQVRYVHDRALAVNTEETVTLTPDGTFTQTRKTTEKDETHTKTDETRTVIQDRIVQVEHTVSVDRIVRVDLRPRWMLQGGPTLAIGSLKPDGAQVAAHVRLFSGVYLGAAVQVRDGSVAVVPTLSVTF